MAARDHITEDSFVLPLATEEIAVSKREIVTGRTRIRIVTDVVEDLVRTELAGEDVEIRHVPVNRTIEPGGPLPEIRTVDGVVIVPVLEEVVTVEKRLLLKEEIHIHRRPTVVVSETPVTLRKQRAVVERLPGDGEPVTEE